MRLALVLSIALAVPAGAQTLNVMGNGPVVTHTEDSRRIAVQMSPGIRDSRQLGDPYLIAARRALGRGQTLRTTTLRALADRGDGFAAFRFAQRLSELDRPDLADDRAHYFGIAAATGRAGAVFGMVKAIREIEPGAASPQRLAQLREILVTYAGAGNSVAAEALIRAHISGEPFGSLEDEFETLILTANNESIAALALQFAVDLMQSDEPTVEDLTRVSGYLEQAARAGTLEMKLIASNLQPLVESQIASLAPAQASVDPALQDTLTASTASSREETTP